jgi:hypothetical protein
MDSKNPPAPTGCPLRQLVGAGGGDFLLFLKKGEKGGKLLLIILEYSCSIFF